MAKRSRKAEIKRLRAKIAALTVKLYKLLNPDRDLS